jgi:hypothetical protein
MKLFVAILLIVALAVAAAHLLAYWLKQFDKLTKQE